MTVQWMLVAIFLYCELAFITLLLLPFISSKIWHRIFHSPILRNVATKANVYFSVFLGVLALFLLDSIREMFKYSSSLSGDEKTHLDMEIQLHMKLFRSQRNYYISGFALFLWLVIRKLIMLVTEEAVFLSEAETAMKRAQNTTETAEKLLKQKENANHLEQHEAAENQRHREEISQLRRKIVATTDELGNANSALLEIKEQATAVSEEYGQLLKKHHDLQKSLE